MSKSRRAPREASKPKNEMIFGTKNYTWLTVGVLCIIFGFTAMRIENEIRGIISLYISPVVIVAGFAIIAWSIVLNQDRSVESKTSSSPE
jgi:dolichyl-phosphate-mannose--protein O-mannosyl transferase